MSDKYIIKNCKALISNNICELYSQKGIHLSSYCYCKDKNCVLKQIVEKCKAEINLRPDANIDDDFAKEILELLDIEECE